MNENEEGKAMNQAMEKSVDKLTQDVKSSFCSEYKLFFYGCRSKSREQLTNELLSKGNIDLTSNDQQNNVKIKLICHMSNFEVIRLQVQLNAFLIEMTILNSEKRSNIHSLRNISNTSASVFVNESVLRNTVIKCIPINNKYFMETFFRVIKQYAIYKISAILDIGPKLSNIFGFDLIIYEECIQFCMQKCSPINRISQLQKQQLKHKLKMLHELQIVHLDIKPDNICWSPTLKELVFIDFGLSDVLQQTVGEKTRTNFVGSLNYCSPELLKCYNNPQSYSLIDLYYNDVFGLTRSFAELANLDNQSEPINDEEPTHLLSNPPNIQFGQIFAWMQIRYLIFESSPQIFKKQSLHAYIMNHSGLVLAFCQKVTYSEYIQSIYLKLKGESKASKALTHYEKYQNYFDFNNQKISSTKFERNTECFLPMIEGITIDKKRLNQIKFTFRPENLKQLLTTRKLIEAMDKEVYYKNISTFINFQNKTSKFSQRIEACKLMIELLGLQHKEENQFSPLSTCFRYLFSYYINSQNESCFDILPFVLNNLVILEALSERELLQCFEQIVNFHMKNTKYKALLLFRCSMILIWVVSVVDSKYDVCQVLTAICSLILSSLEKLAQDVEDRNHSILCMFHHIYKTNNNLGDMRIDEYLKLGENKELFEGSSLKRELKMYYILNLYRYSMYQNDFAGMATYYQTIIQRKQVLRDILFASNFMFVSFFFKTRNFKALEHLYLKLTQCIDHPRIVQKFRLFSYHCYLEYKFYSKRDCSYFKKLLLFLRSAPQKSEKQLLQYISFIYEPQASTMYQDNEIKHAKEQIYQYLRLRFPLSLICNFQQFFNKFYSNFNYFYRMCGNLVFVMNQIHRDNPQFYGLIMDFKNNLLQLIEVIPCKNCQQISYRNTMNIQAYILHQKRNYDAIINLYKGYIFKEIQSKDNDKVFYILEVIKYSLRAISHFNNMEEIIELFFNTVNNDNLWGSLFILPRVQHALEVIHKHLLLSSKLHLFFDVQAKLVQNIKNYQSKEYILSYTIALLELINQLSNAPHLKAKLFSYFENCSMANYENNIYATIFCSIFLAQMPIDSNQKFRWTTIKFICRHIYRLFPFSKNLVLGHLYHSLIRFQASSVTNSSHHSYKLMKYYYKCYLRYAISKQNLSALIFNVSELHSLRKEVNFRKRNSLMSHLKQYYTNMDLKVSQFEPIQKFYESPLTQKRLKFT